MTLVARATSEESARVDDHEARSATRRLLAGLMDAWDAGDADAFVNHFLADGTWTDPQGRLSCGHEQLAAQFVDWRAWEPWSLHWVSNESAPAFSAGSWLWSAASSLDGGARGAWSGGDLSIDTGASSAGRRLAHLVMTDRYRTPYTEGWLVTPHLEPTAAPPSPPAPGARVAAPAVAPLGQGPAAGMSLDQRIDSLTAEIAVRRLMGEFVHAVETGLPAAEVARGWAASGRYELIDADSTQVGEGSDGIGALVEADQAENPTHMQVLMSESIAVDGNQARGRWRDLWTAEHGGEARWMAHQYLVDARRHDGVWQFETVTRLRLLDCSYTAGWVAEAGR